MGTEPVAIHGMQAYLRDATRRTTRQERRPAITQAADILGPGFGPTATLILDWNQDEAAFNGYFYSPVGSINSPDGTVPWAGITITEDTSFGVQQVWSHRSEPTRRLTRRFFDPGGGLARTYTPWVGDTEWQTAGWTAIAPNTINSQNWRTAAGGVVSVGLSITIGVSITVGNPSGDATNTPLVQAPAGLMPRISGQHLGSGAGGRDVSYTVQSDGKLQLVATGSTVSFSPGDVVTASGTYLL